MLCVWTIPIDLHATYPLWFRHVTCQGLWNVWYHVLDTFLLCFSWSFEPKHCILPSVDAVAGILLCAKTKIAKVRLASYFAEGTANGTVERWKYVIFLALISACFKFFSFQVLDLNCFLLQMIVSFNIPIDLVEMNQSFIKHAEFQNSIERWLQECLKRMR